MKTNYKPLVLLIVTMICVSQVNSSVLSSMHKLQYYEDFEIEILKEGPYHFLLTSISKEEVCNWEKLEAYIDEGQKAYVDNRGLKTGFLNFSQILNVDGQSEFEFVIKNRGNGNIQIIGKKGTSWSRLKANLMDGEKIILDPDGLKKI